MIKLGYRPQRTIARTAEVAGVGYLSGGMVRLRFSPAPPGAGVVFCRTDLRPAAHIPARIERVTGTQRRTTLGEGPARVSLVEHVLAALAGLRIDNCYIELNAGEPPGLDGSARQFVEALQDAEVVQQPARRAVWTVHQPLVVRGGNATLALYPAEADDLKISYILDYGPEAPFSYQLHTQVITPQNFMANLAQSRTFLLDYEAEMLRRQGLGSRTTTADLLIIGPRGPIDNQYRHADELARHKVLDIVGDLSLLGQDLRGHVVACRSGHPLNIELARSLAAGLPARITFIRPQAA